MTSDNKIKNILKDTSYLENQIKNGFKENINKKELAILQSNLSSKYLYIINHHLPIALKHNIISNLFRYIFYYNIEFYRNNLQKKLEKNNVSDPKHDSLSNKYKNFLLNTAKFYDYLIKIQLNNTFIKYNTDTRDNNDVFIENLYSSVDNVDLLLPALYAAYKFIIFRGDISRYLNQNISALYFYSLARLLLSNTGSGHPCNQLALLSAISDTGKSDNNIGNPISATYWYLRAYNCINSFNAAKNNLKLLFKKNLTSLSQNIKSTLNINSFSKDHIIAYINTFSETSHLKFLYNTVVYLFDCLYVGNDENNCKDFIEILPHLIMKMENLLFLPISSFEKNSKNSTDNPYDKFGQWILQILISIVCVIHNSIVNDNSNNNLCCCFIFLFEFLNLIINSIISSSTSLTENISHNTSKRSKTNSRVSISDSHIVTTLTPALLIFVKWVVLHKSFLAPVDNSTYKDKEMSLRSTFWNNFCCFLNSRLTALYSIDPCKVQIYEILPEFFELRGFVHLLSEEENIVEDFESRRIKFVHEFKNNSSPKNNKPNSLNYNYEEKHIFRLSLINEYIKKHLIDKPSSVIFYNPISNKFSSRTHHVDSTEPIVLSFPRDGLSIPNSGKNFYESTCMTNELNPELDPELQVNQSFSKAPKKNAIQQDQKSNRIQNLSFIDPDLDEEDIIVFQPPPSVDKDNRLKETKRLSLPSQNNDRQEISSVNNNITQKNIQKTNQESIDMLNYNHESDFFLPSLDFDEQESDENNEDDPQNTISQQKLSELSISSIAHMGTDFSLNKNNPIDPMAMGYYFS